MNTFALFGLHTDWRHWADELDIIAACRCPAWMHHGIIRRRQVEDIQERAVREIRKLEQAMREEKRHGENDHRTDS